MSERAKILGLPKNEVLKPVLLTEDERDSLRKLVEMQYGGDGWIDSGTAPSKIIILYGKLK